MEPGPELLPQLSFLIFTETMFNKEPGAGPQQPPTVPPTSADDNQISEATTSLRPIMLTNDQN